MKIPRTPSVSFFMRYLSVMLSYSLRSNSPTAIIPLPSKAAHVPVQPLMTSVLEATPV